MRTDESREATPWVILAIAVCLCVAALVLTIMLIRSSPRRDEAPSVDSSPSPSPSPTTTTVTAPTPSPATMPAQEPVPTPTLRSTSEIMAIVKSPAELSHAEVERLEAEYREASEREANAQIENMITQMAKENVASRYAKFYAAGGKLSDKELEDVVNAEKQSIRPVCEGICNLVRIGIRDGFTKDEMDIARELIEERSGPFAVAVCRDDKIAKAMLEGARKISNMKQQIRKVR